MTKLNLSDEFQAGERVMWCNREVIIAGVTYYPWPYYMLYDPATDRTYNDIYHGQLQRIEQ